MAEARWDELPDDIVQEINARLPCPLDRAFMGACCKSWDAATRAPTAPQPPRSLPCLLLPLAGGPSVSGGGGGGARHGLNLPDDARRGRFFGSYEGMWAFLELSGHNGHVLLNVRTGERIPLPEVEFGEVTLRRIPVYDDNGAVQSVQRWWVQGPRRAVRMLAATLSSAPAVDGKCVAGAILNFHGPRGLNQRRSVCFWRLGAQTAMEAPEVSCAKGWSPQDIAYFEGRFFVLTKGENLRAYAALSEPDRIRGGDLRIRCDFYNTGRGEADYAEPRVAYLVESRGELLKVVKEWMPDDGAASRVQLFALAPVAHDYPEMTLAWTAVESLDGQLLFVGPGCSRAYECADFPPGCVEEGVYFLDDRTYYAPYFPLQCNPGEFACVDNGRFRLMSARPDHCFTTKAWEGSLSTYSPPLWLMP